jgi:hypothetical protein
MAVARVGKNLIESAFFSNAPFWPMMPCTAQE